MSPPHEKYSERNLEREPIVVLAGFCSCGRVQFLNILEPGKGGNGYAVLAAGRVWVRQWRGRGFAGFVLEHQTASGRDCSVRWDVLCFVSGNQAVFERDCNVWQGVLWFVSEHPVGWGGMCCVLCRDIRQCLNRPEGRAKMRCALCRKVRQCLNRPVGWGRMFCVLCRNAPCLAGHVFMRKSGLPGTKHTPYQIQNILSLPQP